MATSCPAPEKHPKSPFQSCFFPPLASGLGPCYYPDGTLEQRVDYPPCNTTSGNFSMCCATNRGSPDTCLPSGLCHSSCFWAGTDEGDCRPGGESWREQCTDPTWESPFCLSNVFAPNFCMHKFFKNSGKIPSGRTGFINRRG